MLAEFSLCFSESNRVDGSDMTQLNNFPERSDQSVNKTPSSLDNLSSYSLSENVSLEGSPSPEGMKTSKNGLVNQDVW